MVRSSPVALKVNLRLTPLLVSAIMLLASAGLCLADDPEWKEIADRGAEAYAQHDYSTAESLFTQASAMQEQAGMYRRPIDNSVVHLKYALAETYRAEGKTDDAMKEYRWGLAALITAPYDKAFPRAGLNLEPETAIGDKLKYPDNIPSSADAAKILNGIANLYRDEGRFGLAESLYDRVLKMCRESESFYGGILNTFGDKPLNAAQVMVNIGDLYSRQGEGRKAEAEYKDALKEAQSKNGEDSPSLLPIFKKLEKFYRSEGRTGEAADMASQANSIRNR